MSQGLCLQCVLSPCTLALETGFGAVLWLTCGRVFCLVAGVYNVLVANEIRRTLQMVISGTKQSGKSIYVGFHNARFRTDGV